MDDKKRDLIPVAAIALFLVIIIALCAVRLHQRRETRAEIAETESTQIWYSEEQAESARGKSRIFWKKEKNCSTASSEKILILRVW